MRQVLFVIGIPVVLIAAWMMACYAWAMVERVLMRRALRKDVISRYGAKAGDEVYDSDFAPMLGKMRWQDHAAARIKFRNPYLLYPEPVRACLVMAD